MTLQQKDKFGKASDIKIIGSENASRHTARNLSCTVMWKDNGINTKLKFVL